MTAAACTLCVVAASGAVTPSVAATATMEATNLPVVSRSYELTAAADPFTVATLPLQNAWTIVQTVGQLTNWVTPANLAYAEVFKGLTTGVFNSAEFTKQITAAFTSVGTAVTNIVNLPAKILATDLAVLGFNAPAAGAPMAAAQAPVALAAVGSAAAAAAATPGDPVNVATLPFQNLWTIAVTVGQLTNWVTPANLAYAEVFKGLTTGVFNSAEFTKQITAAFTSVGTALTNIVNLPAKILGDDLRALGIVLPSATPAAAQAPAAAQSALGSAVTASAVSASAATPGDPVNIATLPFQNAWTVVQTVGQLTNWVTPTNLAYQEIFKGLTTGVFNSAEFTKQISAAFTSVTTAVTNIVNLPAKIIGDDLRALGILPAATALGPGAGANVLAAPQASQPVALSAAPQKVDVQQDFKDQLDAFDKTLGTAHDGTTATERAALEVATAQPTDETTGHTTSGTAEGATTEPATGSTGVTGSATKDAGKDTGTTKDSQKDAGSPTSSKPTSKPATTKSESGTAKDAGSEKTGSEKTGSEKTGSEKTGSEKTSSAKTGDAKKSDAA